MAIPDNARTGGYNGYLGNDPAVAGAESIKIIQEEYNNPLYARDKPALARELARLGAKPPEEVAPGAQLVGALGSPEANAVIAKSDQARGALSAVPTPAPAQQDLSYDSAPVGQGALSVLPQQRQPFDLQAMIDQFAPKDNSASKYFAIAAALGKPTGFGTLGEKFGNIAQALNDQKANQEKLRSQYVPIIMQQVAAQQARDENHQFMAQQAMQLQQERKMQWQSQLAERQRTDSAAMAAKDQQQLVERAKLYGTLKAASPFDSKEQIQSQVDAMLPLAAPSNTRFPVGAPAQQPAVLPAQPTAAPVADPSLPPVDRSQLTGDAFLGTLNPAVAAEVKAFAEGRTPFTSMSLRSPRMAQLLQMSMQYEPGTDATTYASRNATAKDAATGKLAQSNNALNTVSGHLLNLANAAEGLDNTSWPLVNTVLKAGRTNLAPGGDTPYNKYGLVVNGVTNEFERAYRGAGGSESDIRHWRERLTDVQSPESMKAVLAEAADMLMSKLHANENQYKQGMHGMVKDYNAIQPGPAKIFDYLRGAGPKPSIDDLPDLKGVVSGGYGAPSAPKTLNWRDLAK